MSFITLVLWELLAPVNIFFRSLIFILILIIGFVSTSLSLKFFNEKDPQSIVIDEVVGMLLPLIFIYNNLTLSLTSFLIFRLLDIFKPSIIYYSQFYEKAYGIFFDDIIAGLITLLIIINFA